VDLFRPEDAPGVAQLFHKVYGEGYPVKTFTNPEQLIAENAAHRTTSIVARTPEGDIIGHIALYPSAPFQGLFESGAGLVDPDCRGGELGLKLSEYSLKIVATQFGIEAVFGEPVCNHVIMQKIAARLKVEPCALEVDLMPAEAYTNEVSALGRVATLLIFSILAPKPQIIHVPAAYEEMVRFVYGGIRHESLFVPSSEALPGDKETHVTSQIFEFARVARFAVHEAGADFTSVFEQHEQAAFQKGTIIHQVWLKLSWPWVGCVVDLLHSLGYFLGGVLPRWFDVDGLLMQKVFGPPHWDGIQIFTDRAAHILKMVKADWEEAQGRS
jgi:N-acetylglutamate synthase-like GNAT family acetyltransferase